MMKTTMKPKSLLTRFLVTCSATAVAFCSSLLADDAAVKRSDKSFIEDAYKDGLGEVQLGEMAQRKTGNAEVKALATRLVTDHKAANEELKALAASKKVELATEPGMMADGKFKKLDGKTGDDFERSFVEAVVKDHKDDIQTFEKKANDAEDPDVKAFAAKTLPALKSHLAMAEAIWNKFGK